MIGLHVVASAVDVELVRDLLLQSVDGLEERDRDGGAIEFVLYGSPGELPMLPEGRASVGEALVEVWTEEVPDDWAERWKDWHRPVEIGGRLRVRPPWEPATNGPLDLVIDPGQAFGTGGHHTTRLCLELLLDIEPVGALADWGCGTGVLAIAAAKLGFDPVIAVDHDPASVAATEENAAANGVRLRVARVDLRRDPGPPAPTVVANLVRPLLLEVARMSTERPQHLIVSGLLHHEADEIRDAFALRELDRRASGEWTALRLSR